jgi:Icc protein
VRYAMPLGVLICGVAARLEGLPIDYQELRGLLQPLADQTPVFIGLGNHDDRANFHKAFPNSAGTKATIGGKHVLVIESEPVRVILLDSLLYVNKVAGLLGKNQRAWLAEYLAANQDKPTVLFVHHTLTDNDGDLLDADRLFEIVEPRRQVKAIFFGHSHVWSLSQRKHIQLINLPAVGYNFRDQDPVGWVEARFHGRGVDLTMRAFAGNRADDGKVTRLLWA